MGLPSGGVILDGSWERGNRSPNTSAILALIGIGVLYFNAQSLLALLAVVFAGDLPATSGSFFERLLKNIRFLADPIRVAVVISQYVFMLLPALLLVRRWHSSDVSGYVRLRGMRPAPIFVAVLATVAIIPSSNYISEELLRNVEIPRELLEINAEIFTARSAGELVWLVFVVCVTPAICEEVFFRGMVQRTFERTIGSRSVILIGVLFGLFHFNPFGLITLAVLGVLFGYFFYRGRSLFPAMAAHFANNLVAVLVLYSSAVSGDAASYPEIPGWLAVASLPLGAALLALFHRMTAVEPPAIP